MGFEFDILPKRRKVRNSNDSANESWETAPDPLLVMQCAGGRIGMKTLEVYMHSFLSDLHVVDPLSWGQGGDQVHCMIQCSDDQERPKLMMRTRNDKESGRIMEFEDCSFL